MPSILLKVTMIFSYNNCLSTKTLISMTFKELLLTTSFPYSDGFHYEKYDFHDENN